MCVGRTDAARWGPPVKQDAETGGKFAMRRRYPITGKGLAYNGIPSEFTRATWCEQLRHLAASADEIGNHKEGTELRLRAEAVERDNEDGE